MMITKTVQLEFADPNIRAIDHIYDIRKAAEYAGLNLNMKHNVQLQYPMLTGDDKVVVDIRIPAKMTDFSVGNHLRGISAYLLKKCGDRYQKHLVGKRLLNYIPVQAPASVPAGLSMIDRLEAVAVFAQLLQRSDDEAKEKARRIVAILKEVQPLQD